MQAVFGCKSRQNWEGRVLGQGQKLAITNSGRPWEHDCVTVTVMTMAESSDGRPRGILELHMAWGMVRPGCVSSWGGEMVKALEEQYRSRKLC